MLRTCQVLVTGDETLLVTPLPCSNHPDPSSKPIILQPRLFRSAPYMDNKSCNSLLLHMTKEICVLGVEEVKLNTLIVAASVLHRVALFQHQVVSARLAKE